jgi:short-subunit dehydrogenase
VLPGFTRTEFQAESGITEEKVGLPDFFWMTADAVAVSAIAATARRDPLHVPGVGYKAVAALSGPVPRSVKRWVLGNSRRHR